MLGKILLTMAFTMLYSSFSSLFEIFSDKGPYYDLLSIPSEFQEQTSESFIFVNAATKISTPNHTDPFYTDVCYEITREMCDFCCLIDFEFCTRDIGICEPVEFRGLDAVVDCAKILGGILLGFPILISCLDCFMS